jgi:Holliday junction resolvase
MRGPEAKLYQKFKKATPKILWHRIENLAIPGMPDVLGYTENFFYFTVEFKVTKGNKLRFSPHQIAGRAPRFGELETL